MLQILMGNDPWFRQRRFGYGAGLPFKWQGWAMIAAYIALLIGVREMSRASEDFTRAFAFALLLAVTAIFLSMLHKRTEGGWTWRWGDRDRSD